MSSERSGMVMVKVPLRRVDPAEVSVAVRQQMQFGGVSSLIVDLDARVLVVDRTEESAQNIETSEARTTAARALDPVDVACNHDIWECVEDSWMASIWKAYRQAAAVNMKVSHWAASNLNELSALVDIPVIELTERGLLSQPVVVSDKLGPHCLVACLAPTADALPIEVTGAVLINLEGFLHAPAHEDVADRGPDPGARSQRTPEPRPAQSKRGGPVWFGSTD
mgnify:CR=1 FL=1